MKRYEWQNDGMVAVGPELEYAPGDGCEFVLYEEAHLIEVDRGIKAANLQLLVEKVLSAELLQLSTGRDISPDEQREEDRKLEALVDLARSLKQ